MITLEGEKLMPLPPAALFPRLTDLSFLVSCLPDVGEVRSASDTSAELVLRPSLAFVKGEMHLSIHKVQEDAPRSCQMVLKTKGIGTTSEVVATFTLSEDGNQTRMGWKAEVTQLGGMLKLVPHGLVKGAAQKVISDVLNGIEQKLATA